MMSGTASKGEPSNPDSLVEHPPELALRNISKRFGAIVALDDVSLEVNRGEVLALLGDNGAGKSTLIKCISGVHHVDSGVIELSGKPVQIRSPADARSVGIETVYQDLALFDNLGPSANFYAGRELAGPSWLPGECAYCAAARWIRLRESCSTNCVWYFQILMPSSV